MELTKIYIENCIVTMRRMFAGTVDLILTSPPYSNMRAYNGYTFSFKDVARGMTRVLADGGVIVWVVRDETVSGTESGEAFRQALYFKDVCGLNLHDTMIYNCGTRYPAHEKSTRYSSTFEYMFIFTKGQPKTHNLLKDKKNIWAKTKSYTNATARQKDGSLKPLNHFTVQDNGYRTNIWEYSTGGFGKSSSDEIAFNHPAIFPEKLAGDHILTWSNEGDLVYDPMAGSGTVPKMAHILNRNWVASEISEQYVNDIAMPRLLPYLQQAKLF